MRRWPIALALGLLGGGANALTPDDFAWQWPLEIGSGDVHELVLSADIYSAITRGDALDLALFTAQDQVVSFGPLPQAPDSPWRDAPYALDIGASRREPVASRDVPTAFPSPTRLTVSLQSRVPEAALITALRVSWRHRATLPADARWRVEGRRGGGPVHAEVMAHSYSLANGVGETRLVLSDFEGDALRLSVAPVPAGLEIFSVLAEYESPPGLQRQYLRAALVPDNTVEQGFRFVLPPAMPVSAARIALGDGGALATVALSVRDQDWWRQLATDTAFDVAVGDASLVRNRLAFPTTRARSWRLTVTPPIGMPIVEVGYRPDVFLIAHPGPAQLVLVAGSARAQRAATPVEPLMKELRAQFGNSWTPPPARLGARSERTGKAALQPPPTPPPYRAWLLWTLLVIAAGAITFLALRLLREPARD